MNMTGALLTSHERSFFSAVDGKSHNGQCLESERHGNTPSYMGYLHQILPIRPQATLPRGSRKIILANDFARHQGNKAY